MLSLIKTLVFSNAYFALCVVFVLLGNDQLFRWNLPLSFYLFAFSSTFLLYNFHRLYGLYKAGDDDLITERFKWAFQHKRLLYFLSLLLIVLLLYSIYLSDYKDFKAILFVVLASFFYVFPSLYFNKKFLRLRDIPFIKVAVIAFVISCFVYVSPLILMERFHEFSAAYFFSEFFFYLAIAIPFDIRDFHVDKLQGLRSIPSVYGISSAKQASLAFYFAAMLFAFLFFLMMNLSALPQLLLLAIAGFFAIKNANEKRSELYFAFAIEGLMILRALLWLIL